MHEDLSRDHVKAPSERSFGLTVGAVLILIGVAPVMLGRHGGIRWWAVALGAVLVVAGVVAPGALGPLNRVWFRFGLLLNRIVSPIALGVLFYAVIVPAGLVMRAFKMDPLRLRRYPGAESYWIPRVPPGPPAESMKQQV
jgi:hypothetical protein